VVFVVGAEEGIFPGMRVIGDNDEMEEERRLCYVALTRAKERLYITHAKQRMLFGHTTNNKASRFLKEIPEEYLETTKRELTESDREYGGRWRDSQHFSGGERQRSGNRYGTTGGGRSVYSRQRSQRVNDGRPMGGGITVNHTKALTGTPAYAAQFNLLSQFKKGDMVEHSVFGRGMIVSILPMGGDALVEIAFDGVGSKRLMLKAATQHMKKAETEES